MSILFAEVFRTDLQARIRNPEASFALSQWLIVRGDKAVPKETDCPLLSFDWLKQDMMVIRLDPQGVPYYAYYGARIAAHAGFDMTGRKVSDFKGEIGDFFQALYREIFADPKAIASVHRLGNFMERPLWERVMLPFAQDDRTSAIYVVNRILDLEHDFNMTASRSRNSGIIALQFERDKAGTIASGRIIGANKTARSLCNRRLDEMVGVPMHTCFPGIVEKGLWQKYLDVSTSQQACNFTLPYDLDGMSGVYDVTLSPFRDGILIDFILDTAHA